VTACRFFRSLQAQGVLAAAQRAIGIGHVLGVVHGNQTSLRSYAQQGDIAQIFQQPGVFTAIAQHQILGDELHVHHATTVVLEVK
jgi:hypothetical protein